MPDKFQCELNLTHVSKFSQANINEIRTENDFDVLGGILSGGRFGWLSKGSNLEIHDLRNGCKISSFDFDHSLGFANSIITCVTDIELETSSLLVIGIIFRDSPCSMIAMFSIENCAVLRCIEIRDKVTSCHVVSSNICKRTTLQIMHGCLAVGTFKGNVLLLDLNLHKIEDFLSQRDRGEELVSCHVVSSTFELSHIRQHYKHSIEENVNFCIELESVQHSGIVLSILSVTPLLSLIVGLEDGRMILYDLSELQVYHVVESPAHLSPLTKVAYLEGSNDSRACVHIWAFHENSNCSFAIMHTVKFDHKIKEDDGICLYEGFQCCNMQFTVPTYEYGSISLSCQSVVQHSIYNNDSTISLCILSWKTKKATHLLLFDMNQWYKEKMPGIGDWRQKLSYLVHYQIEDCVPIDILFDSSSVTFFKSIQKSDEHYYPASLGFECIAMNLSSSLLFNWPGLQNAALESFFSAGPNAFLEPDVYFKKLMHAALKPQFTAFRSQYNISTSLKREAMLSIALEYNNFGLLQDCAKCWADGSCFGQEPSKSLSLSTLVEWMKSRAQLLKERYNVLQTPFFDHSGILISEDRRNELSYLNKQMSLITKLYELILSKYKEYIPLADFTAYSEQYNTIQMALEYQEVVLWLLNTNLLPEAPFLESNNEQKENTFIPYPYTLLRSYYTDYRMRVSKLNETLVSSRTQSCTTLFIDSLIEHECNANVLRDQWIKCGGDGLYPPPSLQAMLRSLLVPDVSLENKYALLIYLFLDLNMASEGERYAHIVQNLIKFPIVFKLDATLIKTVQAFWNLDHGQFEIALEDIICPLAKDCKNFSWQQELLVKTLLAQDQNNLALQALYARILPVPSILDLKTLLANDLFAEAYHIQKFKNDEELLKTFFADCLYLDKLKILQDLSLSDKEVKNLKMFLKHANSFKANNFHLVYLLHKASYLEAINYLNGQCRKKQDNCEINLDNSNLILSAYILTMAPAIKEFKDLCFNIRNKLKLKNCESILSPLSCELLKDIQNDEKICYKAIYNIEQTLNHVEKMMAYEQPIVLDTINALNTTEKESEISFPESYKPSQKRQLNEMSCSDMDISNELRNPQKRRKLREGESSHGLCEIKPNKFNIAEISGGTELVELESKYFCLFNTPIVTINGRVKNDGIRYQKEHRFQGNLKVRDLLRSTSQLSYNQNENKQSHPKDAIKGKIKDDFKQDLKSRLASLEADCYKKPDKMLVSKSCVNISLPKDSIFHHQHEEEKSSRALSGQNTNTTKTETLTRRIPSNLTTEDRIPNEKTIFTRDGVIQNNATGRQLSSAKVTYENKLPSNKQRTFGAPKRRRPLRATASLEELNQRHTKDWTSENIYFFKSSNTISTSNLSTESKSSHNNKSAFRNNINLCNESEIFENINRELSQDDFYVNDKIAVSENLPATDKSKEQLNKGTEFQKIAQFEESIFSSIIEGSNTENTILNVDIKNELDENNLQQLAKDDLNNKSSIDSVDTDKNNQHHSGEQQQIINETEVPKLYEKNKYDADIFNTSNISCDKMKQKEEIRSISEEESHAYKVLEENIGSSEMDCNNDDGKESKENKLESIELESPNVNSYLNNVVEQVNDIQDKYSMEVDLVDKDVKENHSSTANPEANSSMENSKTNIDERLTANTDGNKSSSLLRNRRAVSESIETNTAIEVSPKLRKSLRAKSVPRSDSLVISRKGKKRSLGTKVTPTSTPVKNQTVTLETIKENSTFTSDSPSSHTRSRKRLYSTKSEKEQSTNNLNNVDQHNEMPIIQEQNDSENKIQTDSNTVVGDITSRRMTRHQMAVMRKMCSSPAVEESVGSRTLVAKMKPINFELDSDEECDSVKNMELGQPKKRSRSVKDEDETSSVASSAKSKSSVRSSSRRKKPVSKETKN